MSAEASDSFDANICKGALAFEQKISDLRLPRPGPRFSARFVLLHNLYDLLLAKSLSHTPLSWFVATAATTNADG